MEQTADEIRRLQGCINDLISVLALPAMWSGQESAQIVSTLLDVLVGILRLDFAYARLKGPFDEAPIEMVRRAQSRNLTARPEEIGQVLNPWLGDNPQKWPLLVPNPIGDGDVSIVPLRLGLRDEIGVIVAGSQRADFPWETERLLLSVAANQAAIGLQEARLLSEQKRVARELDQRVAQRTRELAAANEELKKEITERRRAEEAVRQTQAELAHMARLTTLGELTASIAHEINQPLGAIVNSANACLRWLAAHNLERAQQSAGRIVADGQRAAATITRIRALAQNAPTQKDWLDLNATIRDVLALVRSAVHRHGVVVETQLAAAVPRMRGDRIQLQQVLLNLVMNAVEALSGVSVGPRMLWVSAEPVASTDVLIAVRDSGPGLEPQSLDRLFEAFYTTKPQGLGLGLAISRRIIEAHGGRLWATANVPQGAVLQFTVPIGSEEVA